MNIEIYVELFKDDEVISDFQLKDIPISLNDFTETIAEEANKILGTNLVFDEHELDVGVQIGLAYLSNYQYSDILYLSTVEHISEDDFDKLYEYYGYDLIETIEALKYNTFKTKKSFVDEFCKINNVTNYEALLPYLHQNFLITKALSNTQIKFILLADSVMFSGNYIDNIIVSKNGIEGI